MTTRAERPAAPAQLPVSTPWAGLERRQVMELALPGVLIGLLAGAIAGKRRVKWKRRKKKRNNPKE